MVIDNIAKQQKYRIIIKNVFFQYWHDLFTHQVPTRIFYIKNSKLLNKPTSDHVK